MAAHATTDEVRDANVRYHDLAAVHYDAKWGIDYGERGQNQVTGKLRKALGRPLLEHFERGLEIGAGTGYFGLNLARAGVVGEYVATDISPGMLDRLGESVRRLDLDIETGFERQVVVKINAVERLRAELAPRRWWRRCSPGFPTMPNRSRRPNRTNSPCHVRKPMEGSWC